MIIIVLCVLVLFVVLCLFLNKKESTNTTKPKNISIDKNSFLYIDICNNINPELFNNSLNHMISKDLFKLSAKDELFDFIKLKINEREYESSLSSGTLKDMAEKIIYDDKDIDLLIGKIFDDQIEKNISECQTITDEHMKFINQFNENSETDLELHPKESNNDESESEEIEEIDLETIISTGTTEEYY